MNIADMQALRYGAQKVKVYPDWISVKDRLPEKYGSYWCYVKHKDYNSCFQCDCRYDIEENEWTDFFGTLNVTHWMPLPPAP